MDVALPGADFSKTLVEEREIAEEGTTLECLSNFQLVPNLLPSTRSVSFEQVARRRDKVERFPILAASSLIEQKLWKSVRVRVIFANSGKIFQQSSQSFEDSLCRLQRR